MIFDLLTAHLHYCMVPFVRHYNTIASAMDSAFVERVFLLKSLHSLHPFGSSRRIFIHPLHRTKYNSSAAAAAK